MEKPSDLEGLAKLLTVYVDESRALHTYRAPSSSPASCAVNSSPTLPVADVWALAHLLVASAEDHLMLLARALGTPGVSVAALTVGRAAQENAARAYWLIEPGLPIRIHVARHYTLLFTDLVHRSRVTDGVDEQIHADASRKLTKLVEHATTMGFQVNNLNRRIQVDAEKAPDSAKLSRIGLSEETAGYGSFQFSLSSSIAHGSGLGVIELSEVVDWDQLELVFRLTSGHAAVTVSAGILAHGLAYMELTRLFDFKLPRSWISTRADLMALVSKCLVKAAEDES